ncbi:MAG: WD40/YVTN/BNR-like repeat-containing protein [Candidatus Eisenbacteria bacterium]
MILPVVLVLASCLLVTPKPVVAADASSSTAAKPAASAPAKPSGKPADNKKSTTDKKSSGKGEETKDKKATPFETLVGGLAFRSIGPAFMSGRIGDVAVDPIDMSTWYVVVCSGGVWKTTNAGVTFTPVFDGEGAYSIGCVTVDPHDPLVVWVGSGENNSQRSVGYGDGLYRSTDAGRSWKNVGLKDSEHIGRIVVDPRDSKVVYVAAQGPLWKPGGDRGLYKTTDAGVTWSRILDVNEWTGANEVALDPTNPDVVYCTTYQRHRKVWTLIDGGPGSGIQKSTDGGKTWNKLTNGLPTVDMGRIGIAISAVDHDLVYAWVEAAQGKSGFFRSTDAGAHFDKMSGTISSSPQYYQKIFADPQVKDRVYAMDTWMQVSEDGGKSFHRVGEAHKHVDNHALWIDPRDNRHLIAGCDGGLYETFDRGATWDYKRNLPVTQFYKLAVDDAKPFYNVYGGTQDNNTQGGPVRTTNVHGIRNWDWFVTTGGDGFQPRVDPTDPNIVYSESQHAGIIRFDKLNGEQIDIQPQPEKGEPGSRWNWDAPYIISPHSHTRLYLASQRLYRSDDRGDTWTAVSADLTRQVDRNKLKMMGRVWSVDAVAKNASTSFYGNCVALCESPRVEGLLYVGTDDGLVQVSEDGGKSWRKQDKFAGVPDLSYVSRLEASQHADNVVYASFDNHKMGDFKPYVLRSNDRGRSWTSITGDLPARGEVHCLAEDPVDPQLLFAGTEFGLWVTRDGGKHWVRMKNGLPTISVRDLAVQKRENDLVLATFGRSFYVLDDYTPLRNAVSDDKTLGSEGAIFPIKPAVMYVPSTPMGSRDQAEQGDSYYVAKNPPFGAVFSYWLKDGYKSMKDKRHETEAEIEKKGGDTFYPSWDTLRAEEREEEPSVVLVVSDAEGNVIRRIPAAADAGLHRVAWDFTYPPANPATLEAIDPDRYDSPPTGPRVVPGHYQVALVKRIGGKLTTVAGPNGFDCQPLGVATLPAHDDGAVLAFQRKTARLQRAVYGAQRVLGEAQNQVALLKKAFEDTPGVDPALMDRARWIEGRLKDIDVALNGDALKAARNEPTPPSIADRVNQVVYGQWGTTTEPTATHKHGYDLAAQDFAPVLDQLRDLVDRDLRTLEAAAEHAGAPWTPGRLPEWKPE